MAFDDIKKAILAETNARAEEIKAAGRKEIEAIRQDFIEKREAKKRHLLEEIRLKADRKLQQTEFKFKSKMQEELLGQKHKIIDRVYSSAYKKLSEISDQDYIDLMAKLLADLPDTKGEVVSARGKEELLKKALKKSGKKFDLSKNLIGDRGGFIFKSKDMEINQTFASLIQNTRDQTALEITNKLFKK